MIKLSPYAKIFYTEWLLDPTSSRYNLVLDQTFYGNLDVGKLRTILKRYVSDHVLMNSHINEVNGEPYWVKNDFITELEYANGSVDGNKLFNYTSKGFELRAGPLYRFRLIRISRGIYRFIAVFHHLIVDGSGSLDLGVFEAISNYYNNDNYTVKYSIDKQIKLITKLTDNLSARLICNQVKYQKFWHKQLANVENVNLSFLKSETDSNHKITKRKSNAIKEILFSFGEKELAKLKQIKLKHGISLYRYGLCIFAMLLNRYTSQDKLTISYPIAINEGNDFIYGAQINTNLIVFKFDTSTTIIDLFKQANSWFQSTRNEHSYCPIPCIINSEKSKQLLNICFIQTFFREKAFTFNGITKVEISSTFSTDAAAEDVLLFEHDARDNKLNFRVRYDKESFNKHLLKYFISCYKKTFLEVLENLISEKSDTPLSSYNILDQKQYQKIVFEFNQTNHDYQRYKTIHQLFEEQVLNSPNSVAVVFESIKLTYKTLNQRANRLANYLLQNYRIKPDDLIVLCVEKNEYMIIALFAILKAGGAYVPIDPTNPDSRIDYIVKDTKAKVVMANANLQNRLQKIIDSKKHKIELVIVDGKITKTESIRQQNNNPVTSVTSNNLIYAIYTSGTTGTPKATLIEHHCLVNYAKYLIDNAKLNTKSNGCKYASLSFDASACEIFPIILSGGTLYILKDEDRLDSEKTNTYFNEHHITYAFLPTKFAELFFRQANCSLSYLLVAGEKLETFINQPYTVVNGYGPTEASVHTTSFLIDRYYHNIPIGKPINNVKCYVTDQNLQLMPIGAIGELMIGGESLARGYFNKPDLTAKKFIPNPFQTEEEKLQNKNCRLYKTGDLVRMLPDGNIEYIGRNDFQVKISGFRIELSEIENKLISYPEIKQAVVIVCEQSSTSKYLAAYYVAEKKLDETKIHEYLASQLPGYMLPKIITYLSYLPLTVNGKVDKAVLPAPSFFNDDQYLEPRNEQEDIICKAFSKILGTPKVGINDDFFKLGGNSLSAISLVAILQNDFDIKVSDIFKLRTPLRIAGNSEFGKNVLKEKLEQIKSLYKNKIIKKNHAIDQELQNRVDHYLKNIYQLKIDYSIKSPITNVLLTGVTGYLGCNILDQLLKLTNYNIFLLIRANSNAEAVHRINEKFKFYFDQTLDGFLGSRVFVLQADIEKNNLGLSDEEYQLLVTKIDSTIHSAALVKHYGEYAKFYSANVQATINLLEFTKLTKLKDFHYISTYSVLNFGFIPNYEEYVYTEDDLPDNLVPWHNVYTQTKLQGERETIKYRNAGINASIYRVGNLAFISKNYRVQENVDDNAFFSWLKCLFKLQCIAEDISLVEISQVDYTAEAIVKLFDKLKLANNIFHVFNPCLYKISDSTASRQALSVKTLTMAEFIDNLVTNLGHDIYHDLIIRFLLHQGWLDDRALENITSVKIEQNRTQYILRQLDFEWQPITNEVFHKYLALLT